MAGKKPKVDKNTKGDGVKSRVDTALALVRIPGLAASLWTDRRVRALHQGGLERMVRGEPGECSVIKELMEWKRGNAKEFQQIMEGLRYLAESPEIRQIGGVKFVGKDIIEVKAGHRRLYCFLDPHTKPKTESEDKSPADEQHALPPDEEKMTTQIVIAAVTQSVNAGNKDNVQRQSIRRAAGLLKDWRESVTNPQVPRVRFKTH